MNKKYRNIALIGMPGSGKTTIGRLVADILKLKFYDLDEYIEKKAGMGIPRIFDVGEEYFRTLETNVLMEISNIKGCVISTGGGVVKKPQNMERLSKTSLIVFIDRPIESIMGDIDTTARPLLSQGRERLYQLYEERYPLYKQYCDYEIVNDGTIDGAVEKIERLTCSGLFRF